MSDSILRQYTHTSDHYYDKTSLLLSQESHFPNVCRKALPQICPSISCHLFEEVEQDPESSVVSSPEVFTVRD